VKRRRLYSFAVAGAAPGSVSAPASSNQ
jgi:hypothetical protein